MSKTICNVCGTAYPESASQCPICGCVRAGTAKAVDSYNNTEKKETSSGSAHHVKGGRFSKSNVKKRTRATQKAYQPTPAGSKKAPKKNENDQQEKYDRRLLIPLILIMILVAAVVVFLIVRFLTPALFGSTDKPTSPTTSTAGPTSSGTVIPCEKLTLTDNLIVLDAIGSSQLLNVTPTPADTTETITFVSSDPTVAVVTDRGKITLVGAGQAEITVTCGTQAAVCVVVSGPNVPTEPSQPTDPLPTEPTNDFKLNRFDITFSYEGESWLLYNGAIPKDMIQWTTDNAAVASIEAGRVKAVGPGMTKVYGEYKGQKLECIIRCAFEASGGNTGGGGITEDGGSTTVAVSGTVKVDDVLNVRSGPGTSYDKVGTLTNGQIVMITEQQTVNGVTWGKISSGWISMEYVVLNG